MASTTAVANTVSNSTNATPSIWGDNLCLKFAALLPGVGDVVACTVNDLLKQQFERAVRRDTPVNNDKVIQLIDLKNDYLMIGIVRKVLDIALLVAGAVLLFFAGIDLAIPLGIAAGLYAIGIFVNIADIVKNKADIQEIRDVGIRPGLFPDPALRDDQILNHPRLRQIVLDPPNDTVSAEHYSAE